jgi:transcriptional regulator
LHFVKQNELSSTTTNHLADAFKQKALRLITAFEIEEIDTVFKLSQDRDQESYQNIIEKLKVQNEYGRVIAAEMKKRINKLFPSEK